MRISKGRGVCDHDAGITVLPKGPLVRPRDAGNECRQCGAFGRNFFLRAKNRYRAAQQCARMRVADEADEIANGGIKNTEPWRRISLRTRRVGEIADGFQADHGGDFVAVGLASARRNRTAQLPWPEVLPALRYQRRKTPR